MVRKQQVNFLSVFLCGVGLAVVCVGCATQGYQRVERTTESMANARTELIRGKKDVAIAISTLNKLAQTSTGDLRPTYSHLVGDLQQIESQAKTVKKQTGALDRDSSAYLNAWAKEVQLVQNPDIRAVTAERRNQVKQDFARISQELELTKKAYGPLIADLKDIRMALNYDLTSQGVVAISELINLANSDATNLETQINRTVTEIDRVSETLSPKINTETVKPMLPHDTASVEPIERDLIQEDVPY